MANVYNCSLPAERSPYRCNNFRIHQTPFLLQSTLGTPGQQQRGRAACWVERLEYAQRPCMSFALFGNSSFALLRAQGSRRRSQGGFQRRHPRWKGGPSLLLSPGLPAAGTLSHSLILSFFLRTDPSFSPRIKEPNE